MNCQKAISLIPLKDLIEDILDAKEECELKAYQEYYESLKEYKINKERLNKENLLLDDGYLYKTDSNGNLNKVNGIQDTDMKIIGNAKTFAFMPQFFNITNLDDRKINILLGNEKHN